MTTLAALGISSVHAISLSRVGVSTAKDLLELGNSVSGRKAIANKTLILESWVERWVNRADLSRIPGMDLVFMGLLEDVGAGSVVSLGACVPEILESMLTRERRLWKASSEVPPLSELRIAVRRAAELESIVT
jgi:hypothetical protein